MKIIKPLDFLVFSVSVAVLGSLVLAIIDPSFRPIFGEIVKSLAPGAFQSLITKL